jgi:hypothetical protein
MFSPLYIPVISPITVIPICTVLKKVLGALANSRAAFAFRLPCAAKASSLAFLAETKAISDMENKPFNKMSKKRMNISM